MTCLSTDTKPTGTYLTGWTALETDTGSEYYTSDGTTWTIISGNSKTETLTNKTISYLAPNTIAIDQLAQQFYRSPDLGMWGAHCADGSSSAFTPYGQFARFLTSGTLAASASLISTEGLYLNLGTSTTINSKAGWVDSIAGWVVMDSNPSFKIRMRLNQTTLIRVLMGFNAVITIPTTDTLNTSGTNTCAMWGKRTTDTNWQAVTCNGTTTTYTDLGQAVSSTGFHTYEIKLSSGGVASFFYDGTQLGSGISTTTPLTGTGMHLVNFITNSTAANKTYDLKYDIYRADF